MRIPAKNHFLLGLVAAACVAAAAPARADVVLASTGHNDIYDVTVRSNGTIKFANGSTWSVSTDTSFFQTTFFGANGFKPQNTPFETFCVDLGQFITQNGKIGTALNANVSLYGGSSVDKQGNSRDIGAAGWILNNFQSKTLGELAAFIGVGSISAAERSSALQLAVWKAAYDPTSTDITDSSSKLWVTGQAVSKSWVVSLANAMLEARGSQTADAGFINYPPPGPSPYSQDMLFGVPEPSSLAIAGLGAIGLIAYLRPRRAAR